MFKIIYNKIPNIAFIIQIFTFCLIKCEIIFVYQNLAYRAEHLIAKPVSDNDSKFIEDLANELGIFDNFEVYYTNALAHQFFGPNNIFSFNNKLFIGPYVLDSIPIEQKRFAIARELILIANHNKYFAKKIHQPFSNKYLRDFALIFGIPTLLTIKTDNPIFLLIPFVGCLYGSPLIVWYYYRKSIFNADANAAVALEDFDSAIDYLTTYEKYFSDHNAYVWGDCGGVNNPSLKKRIRALEELKDKYF